MRSSNIVRRSFIKRDNLPDRGAAFGLVVCSAVSSPAAEPDNAGLTW